MALGAETKIMGILNVTPDSFSDAKKFLDPGRAAAHAFRMEREGAHFLDIGAESSRPGARPVSAREEIRRLRPVLKRLSGKTRIPISVDTYKYDVASMALEEGASIINDIYGLRADKRLSRLIAREKAGVVLMHMQGEPGTMQKNPVYRDVIGEILAVLKGSVDAALASGIARSAIVIDPGFGFGKTVEQNLEILRCLEGFSALRLPVLAGMSRKSFLGKILGSDDRDRLYGSLGAAAAAIAGGAHLLRVHEVLPHRHLAVMMDRVYAGGTFLKTGEKRKR